MAFTDNRSAHLNLPLPDVGNELETDVQRIIECVNGLDNAIHLLGNKVPANLAQSLDSLSEGATSLGQALGINSAAIVALQESRGAANGIATLGVDSKIPVGQLPALAASIINSGTFDAGRIPELPAGQVTSGTFAAARIPDLDAAKVTTGTFNVARIPSHSTDKLTSGILPVARGGTGLDAVAAGAFLKGNGAGAMTVRTAAELRSDISAMPSTGGTMTGSLTVQGDIAATGNVAGYSDRRLKKSIKPIRRALDKVLKLRGVTYVMRDTDKPGIGFVAQELQQVVPELVGSVNDRLTVAYGNMTGLLVAALQELSAEVSTLKSRAR